MRKRIQQLATGKFEYARPLLSFSTDKVDIEVLEGKDYAGDFVITSANQVPLRGVIYTSDARMECLTPQFEGKEVRIRYQFHSNGFVEGDIQKGEFYIICNQGEYNLSFVVSVSKLYAETSAGRIRNLGDFAELARTSPAEASHLFYSKNFKNVIKAEESRERRLYDGLSKGAAQPWNVEEFLIGTGKKKEAGIKLSAEEAEYFGVLEERKERVEIHRSQWGYVDIDVRSDADFLVPGKGHLTAEDFIGSVCIFEYYIRESALHAGRNFGRLCFELPGRALEFTVCASRTEMKSVETAPDYLALKEGKVRLTQLYVDYRLKKIVTGAWANRSIEILEHLMALEPDREFYSLMKAQALLVNKQRQEASWIMEDYKRTCIDRQSPEWGYYLYLCTLMEREPSYVDRVTDEIEEIFKRHPDSSLLFWILLFVRESYYQDHSGKYKAIEQWVQRGCKSPFLYLEAYYLVWQDPYLLGRMDPFAIEVLNWAVKQEALSKDIALQIMQIVPGLRGFHPFVYRILEVCYGIEPDEKMLSVICGYLIKGQRYDIRYHRWFELGIEHKIRLTGLYEAYLLSLDKRQVTGVPKMIQLYFQYDSALSYEQKAVLFVNIIVAKQKQPEVYQKYRRTMEQFAMEQIEASHISDNLAVVYDEMLCAGILDAKLARRLPEILFTHKLTCQNRRVSQAVILHTELEKPQTVQFMGGTAYFKAYTKNYSIVLLDTRGNGFCETVPYQDEMLLNPEAYIGQCLALAPEEISYVLYAFHGRDTASEMTEQSQTYSLKLISSEVISVGFKSELVSELVRHYRQGKHEFLYENSEALKYLEQAAAGLPGTEARRQLAELLTEAHRYEQAYRMVQADGYEFLGSAARVALCGYAIGEAAFEEDDFLLGFAESTFLRGKYSEVLLIYLCKYYNGATKTMAELWRAAGAFGIDTFDLEERILTQMLYTTEYMPYTEQIYESYCAGGGRELVCMAYLSYFAHVYLVQDAVVPAHVFAQIMERYLLEQELNGACRIGMLKCFAEKEVLSDEELRVADELLEYYTARGTYFAFYRKFAPELIRKYQLYDKYFLEYHTAPGQRVIVHFRMGGNAYEQEDLTEMYDGIYVREFTLFFGETVQYYIEEESGPQTQVSESNCISNRDILAQSGGRYARLNEMLLQITLEEPQILKRQMKQYYGMMRVTEEVFKLL